MPTGAAIAAFKSSLRGELIQPSDPAYPEARKVYNAMIDKKPRLIARVADVADVITAVNFAREQRMLVAIQSGGHNAGGLGSVDDGLVIQLTRMKGVRVDPVAKTVRVEGGCTWGDVDHATHAFGYAVPTGIISTTGVGGLALGGGLGHLTRGCGLTIDNILEVDMVLADGRFVTANARKNADLFWAVRGGGGNFGVVTSFLFRMHQVHTDYAGPIIYELGEATEVMKWYRDFIKKAPNQLTGFFLFLVVPPGPPFPEHLHMKKMCGVAWCYSGPLKSAEKLFKPIRAFKTPALRGKGETWCDGVGQPRRPLCRSDRRRRSRSAQQGKDHPVGARLLVGGPSLQHARRVCELHDGRRGRRAGPGDLSKQLQEARLDQAETRQAQPVQGEPEHQAVALPHRGRLANTARLVATGRPEGLSDDRLTMADSRVSEITGALASMKDAFPRVQTP